MRLVAAASLLCVIDVQDRLLPAMADGDRVVSRCDRLAAAARLLDVPAGFLSAPLGYLPPAEAEEPVEAALVRSPLWDAEQKLTLLDLLRAFRGRAPSPL